MTNTQSPDVGAFAEVVESGRGDTTAVHLVVRVWDNPLNANQDGRGYYAAVPIDGDWAQAWSEAELFTYDPGTQGVYASTDHDLAEDRTGQIHVFAEANQGLETPYRPFIGYKRRGAANWGPSSPWAALNTASGGVVTSNIWLQETTHGDTLHVTWANAGTSRYSRKGRTAPDASWDAESVVTTEFGAPDVAVDASGRVHFFAQVDSGDYRLVVHRYGTYPGPGQNWTTQRNRLAIWNLPVPSQQSTESEGLSDLAAVVAADSLYHSYTAFDSTSMTYETFLRQFSPGSLTWSAPVRLTPNDGVDSRLGQLRVSGGVPPVFHMSYHEPKGGTDLNGPWSPADTTRIYHRYNVGQPMNAASWSVPTEIAPERRTTSSRLRSALHGDTLWVTWVSYDDDYPEPGSDDDWEVWARSGHALADTLESANVTLAGAVYLDSDLEVQSGKTLTIAPGTTVYLLASPEPDQVDILVSGALVAVGTETEPITFVAYRPTTGAATWGSVVFLPGADGSSSRLEHVVIRDATAGLRCAGTAPSLRNVTFEGNTLAEIVLEGDTRIETGSEWILDAPLRVMALELPTSEDTLGTDGYTDLIVPGLLETVSAATPDSVYFTSFAKDAAHGDDWGGITVPSGGRGLLRNCDIGYALRGVYFADADSAVLVDSRVHHYSLEGVFDYGSDALVQACTVTRGSLDLDIPTSAIHAKASAGEIRDNTITWQTDFGIWIQFGKLLCKDLPWGPTDTLRVVGNTITGDGTLEREKSAAIRGEYLCLNHATLIDDNDVTTWRGRALDLYQTADVHVTCNRFHSNFAGGEYFRNATWLDPSEEDVFWKGNSLRQNASDNLKIMYETGLRFYDAVGGGAAAGENTLQKYNVPEAKNIRMAGGSLAPVVDARHQAWLDASGAAITDSVTIQATNAPGPAEIKVGSALSGDESCTGGGATAQAGGRSGAVDTAHGRTATSSLTAGVPTRWSLAATGSNPTSGAVSWVLGAPIPSTVRLTVYDVRGRLVRRLGERPVTAGYHEWRWDRSAEDGGTVASGVYFLRVESPEFRHTRKVVLLSSGS